MRLSDLRRHITGRELRYVKRRNQLVVRHLFLVAPVAQRLKRALPRWIELDELKADGAVGLVHAAIRFEPRRAVPFARFATRYIRGAMFDGVRRRWRGPRSFCNLDVETQDRRFDLTDARLDAPGMLMFEADDRRRLILLLYYFDGLTMKRIGGMLGISEARVSQLVKRSVALMRTSVSPRPAGERFFLSGCEPNSAPLRVAAKRRRAA